MSATATSERSPRHSIAPSARRVLAALRLDLANQARFSFPQIYLGLAIAYVALFRFVEPLQTFRALATPAFLFSEPGMLGLYFAALHFYLERADGSLAALAVTPLSAGEYVLGRALSVAIIGTVAGELVWLGAFGPTWGLAALFPLLFACATLFGLVSLALAPRFSDTIRFIFATVPVMFLLTLPYASFFGLLPRLLFVVVPSHPALFGFGALAADRVDWLAYTLYLLQLVVYALLAHRFAVRAIARELRGAEGVA